MCDAHNFSLRVNILNITLFSNGRRNFNKKKSETFSSPRPPNQNKYESRNKSNSLINRLAVGKHPQTSVNVIAHSFAQPIG